jgi:flagellar biosynthesis protein FlhF
MERRTFTGPDLGRLLVKVREAFGEDALVIRTRSPRETDGENYEVIASSPDAPQHDLPAASRPKDARVIALVGPSGSGKTTTAVKLALNAEAFGERRVGLLTLDTYRAAGVEQLNVYAEIASLPLEVAYDLDDVARAFANLAGCETIIVDTPARGMRGANDLEWRALLAATNAGEIHLVVPATMRIDLARELRETLRWSGVTHALVTKVDEIPDRSGLRELREQIDLPIRWFCNGQDVPHDLYVAPGGAAGARSVRRAG